LERIQAEAARAMRRRSGVRQLAKGQGGDMLWTLAVILVILWLLGLLTSYTLGGFIHILLVIALIVVVVRLVQGRRVL
jgi:hypothetical protein